MGLFNFFKPHLPPPSGEGRETVAIQKVLHRVLAATGHTIDDVVNDPLVKRKVLGFYKLHHWVNRQSEIFQLERQWNTTPRMPKTAK